MSSYNVAIFCLFIFLVIVIFSLTMMKSYIWNLSWTVISVYYKVWVLYDLIKYAHNGSYSFFFPSFFDRLANQTLLNLNIYLVESHIVYCFAKSFVWVKYSFAGLDLNRSCSCQGRSYCCEKCPILQSQEGIGGRGHEIWSTTSATKLGCECSLSSPYGCILRCSCTF